MNSILVVARKVKGVNTDELAGVLQIEESEYIELEHSITDITANQALILAKYYDLEPELFLYADGRETRLVKYATDEMSKIISNIQPDELPPRHYFHLITLGNTALTLQVELGNALYRQYELEKDNSALRKLLSAYKTASTGQI